MCIEVNAANLLNLVRRFRDEGRPELFLTTLFDSQACERAFRQFRAMGTPNFTKVNFTLYELLNMTRRYEVQNDIIYNKLPNIKLPKLERSKQTTKIYSLPSEDEIVNCLNRAKRFALEDALRFGININQHEIDECNSNIPKNLVNEELDEEVSDEEDDIDLLENVDVESLCPDEDDLELVENEETLPHWCLKIKDHRNPNKEVSMRKSTFVWNLTEGTKRISGDRLIRVQNSSFEYATKSSQCESSTVLKKVNVIQSIRIGDWCFFKHDTDDNKICIGLVLAFKFVHGKNAKEKRYNGDFVDLKEYKEKMPNNKRVAALSSWYFINGRGHLIPVKNENHFFIEIDNYVATVVKPMNDKDTSVLFFSENDFKEIERDILAVLNT